MAAHHTNYSTTPKIAPGFQNENLGLHGGYNFA